MNNELVLDIEVDGDPWTGRLLVAGYQHNSLGSEVRQDVDRLSPWLVSALADPSVPVVEHSKFDARWLRLAGVGVCGPVYDTMTMGWTIDENSPLDLEFLVRRYCGVTMDKRISRNKNVVRFRCDDGNLVSIADAPFDQLLAYNRRDVEAEVQLYHELAARLVEKGLYKTWHNFDVPFTSVLLDMECEGMLVDVEAARELRDDLSLQRDALDVALRREARLPANFNLNSGDQVAAYLYLDDFELPDRVRVGEPVPDGFTVTKTGRLWNTGTWQVKGKGLIPKKRAWTKSGTRPKCDAATLAVDFGSDSWVQEYLVFKELDKLIGTYLGPMIEREHDGRLYCKFNQTATVTGRLSSSELNLQNIPSRGRWGSKIRGLFVGDLIFGDFSMLEPRLMAHFSQDPGLLRIFEKGYDIYRILGETVFERAYDAVTDEQRDACKELLLSMGYGAMAPRVAERISLRGHHTDTSTAQQYLDALREAYPVFWEWKEEVVRTAEKCGYVETISGRRRSLANQLKSEDWNIKTHGERQAVNSIIQGSAADIVKETMLTSREAFPDLPILIQVHDEIGFELTTPELLERRDEICKVLQQIGENPSWKLSVPLVFKPKYCKSWAEK